MILDNEDILEDKLYKYANNPLYHLKEDHDKNNRFTSDSNVILKRIFTDEFKEYLGCKYRWTIWDDCIDIKGKANNIINIRVINNILQIRFFNRPKYSSLRCFFISKYDLIPFDSQWYILKDL